MADPAFSIVIPVHDRPEAVVRAVRSCLVQSFGDFEIIVVDDGSTVAASIALEPLDDPRLRVVRLARNGGVSNARNVGIDAAAGRYIAFLDSDDEFTADKLATCHEALDRQGFPDDLCLGSRIYIRREAGHRAAIPSALIEPGESVLGYVFVRGGILSTDTLVIAAPLARKARFRTDLTRHEDYDYLWRLERAGARFAMLPEALAVWYDEELPGRLTKATGYRESRYWLESIAERIPREIDAACRLRVLGPLAARSSTFGGVPIFLRNARAARTMSWKSKWVCLLKCTAPRLYTHLTGIYVRLAAARVEARTGAGRSTRAG